VGLFQELRRRKVTRVAAVYVVTAWLLLQIVDVVGDPLRLPEWFATVVVVTLGIGFPLALVLAWAFEVTPDGVRRATSQDGAVATPPGQSRIDYVIIGLLVIAIGVMIYDPQSTDQRLVQPVAEESAEASDAEVEDPSEPEVLHNSVAVLPFDNLSPDPNNAYFAAGIHEEILNQLAKIKDLSVIARTTMLRYVDSDKPVPEIGAELRVGTVMEGSVRYAGNRVRITTQLIDVATGAHLWSEAYEEPLEDVFGIQRDIATRVADALTVELTATEASRIATRVTEVSEAYIHYLNAMSKWGNFAHVAETLAALDAAISLDPDFAAALAFKAWTYAILAGNHQFHDPLTFDHTAQQQLFTLADETAKHALALDDDLAFAHLAAGNVAMSRLQSTVATSRIERALSLNSSDYRVVTIAGVNRISHGSVHEGVEMIARAIELNPADAANIWFFSTWLAGVRRLDEAIRQALGVTAVAPDAVFGHSNLALISAWAGDADRTRVAARRAELLAPGAHEYSEIARAYARIGDEEDAQRVVDEAMAKGYGAIPNPYWHYGMHVAMGDEEAALDALERIVETRFPIFALSSLALLRGASPEFDVVRDNPRFKALVAKAESYVQY